MMEYRTLGKTGIRISALAFGCGPVSGWMADLGPDDQGAVVKRAIDLGINWFDTAAGYGDGKSEASLGAALARLGYPEGIHVATKIRYPAEGLGDIRAYTRTSVQGSLKRLGLERVSLLQLHNSITERRGEEPTSLTPEDVVGPGGVLESFRELQAEGVAAQLGLTGIGQATALRAAVSSGGFAAIQVPYNLLNPSAGFDMPADFSEANYGNIIAACRLKDMGIFAFRVFAGGALLGRPPSAHTHKTLFFPLALYERDCLRADRLAALLSPGGSLHGAALRFVLNDPRIASAIIGFRSPAEIDQAAAALSSPPAYKPERPAVETAAEPIAPEISQIALESFMVGVAPHSQIDGWLEFARYASPEAIAERMRRGHIFYVARQGAAVVGIAEIRPPAHLAMLFVRPGRQRQGVGKELLAAAIQGLRAARGPLVLTAAPSPNSIGAYEKFGFVADGDLRQAKGIRFLPMRMICGKKEPPGDPS